MNLLIISYTCEFFQNILKILKFSISIARKILKSNVESCYENISRIFDRYPIKKKKKKKLQIQESSKKIYVNIKNQVIYFKYKKIFLISYLNFKSLTYFLTNYNKSFAFIIRRNQCSCHI